MIKKMVGGFVMGVLVSAQAFGGALNTADVSSAAKWVVHLDVEQFMAGKLGKQMTDEAANPELKKGLDMLREKIGFDPLKTMISVTLYGESYQREGGVAVVKGKADAQVFTRIEAMITGAKTHEQVSYGARVIHKWIDERKQKPGVLCFYAPGVLVAGGDVEKVKAAIDVLDGKKAALKEGAALKLPGTSGFLAVTAGKCDGQLGGQAKAAILQNADWITLSIGNAGDNVDLDLQLGANSAENAQQMEQVVRGLVAFMTLSKEQNPLAAELAKAISVHIDNGVVGVKFSYAAEPLVKVMKAMKAMKNRRGARPAAAGQQEPESTTNGTSSGDQLFKF